jgi:hypothetical protein
MFTLNVRGLTRHNDDLASLAYNPGNAHFTLNINLTKWLQLTRQQQIEVLMHEMGHIACQSKAVSL